MITNLPSKIEPIPPVDRTAPERTANCLPPWLMRSASAVNGALTTTIPEAMALTSAQRCETERHVAELAKAAKSGPGDRIGAAVMGVLAAFPAQASSPEATKARSIMYREALADLPAWAVERAVCFWNRGEHGQGNENYAFPPSPPQLRRLARLVADPVRHQYGQLRRLLDAEVVAEPKAKDEDAKARVAEMASRAFRSIQDAASDRPTHPTEQGR